MTTWLVSNRLPFRIQSDGGLARTDGGLVTALLPVHESGTSWWVGQGGFPVDSSTQERLAAARVVDVSVPTDLAAAHYNGASNGGIWPLFHYFPAIARFRPEDWGAYRAVNRAVTETILARAEAGDTVWIHDYQLMLVPGMLREQRADLAIGYFHHIPFPASEVFKIHPARDEILAGLLGADVIGFHTLEYARHFTAAAARLRDVAVVAEDLHVEDRIVRVGAFPLGIDVGAVEHSLASPAHATALADLERDLGGRRLVLGVDRLDYTKGIRERLAAFERVLRCRPDLRSRATFIQLCVPSRIEVDRYDLLRQEIEREVGRINGELGSVGHTPIHYLFQRRNLDELTALYRRAEVALVTPLRDGLNLVCKEYVACHPEGDGMLVLSEFAGAAEEMGEALVVNPYDVEAVAEAILRALDMPKSERRERMEVLHARVVEADNRHWAADFLAAVTEVAGRNRTNASRSLEGPELTDLHRRLAAGGGLVAIDADLVPLDHPLLRQGMPGLTILLISSRPVEDCERSWSGLGVWIAAERGASLRDPSGTWRTGGESASLEPYRAEVLRCLEKRARLIPRSRVIVNHFSIHWHIGRRPSPLAEAILRETGAILDGILARSPWHAVRTGAGLVLRNGLHTAGTALTSVTEAAGLVNGAAVVTVGDRFSDESLFAWGGTANASIAVGSPVTHATYLVAHADEACELLSRLLAEDRP